MNTDGMEQFAKDCDLLLRNIEKTATTSNAALTFAGDQAALKSQFDALFDSLDKSLMIHVHSEQLNQDPIQLDQTLRDQMATQRTEFTRIEANASIAVKFTKKYQSFWDAR